MKEGFVIEIITPKKLVLNGLWFGPKTPTRVIIFIHGLASNAFAGHDLALHLINESTAVVTFSNRGHDKIARMKRVDKRKKSGYTSLIMGEAHELFTDCVDDIQGVADYVHNQGVGDIFLMGHSTGCQKSVYYLSRRGKQKNIKGVILLAPMSDYAGALYKDKNEMLSHVTTIAKSYVKEGNEHKLLPLDVWSMMHDAQRFLSLYTPDSKEELFSYCQKIKIPKTYQAITIPQLVLLGEKDESRDRNMKKIAQWFEKNCKAEKKSIGIIQKASHSFFQHENEVINHIKIFIKNNSL